MGIRGGRATAGPLHLRTLRKLRGLFLAAAKLGPPEEFAEPEAAVVAGDGLVLRPCAVEIVGERVHVVLDQHGERDPTHRPRATDATADVGPAAAPGADCRFRLAGVSYGTCDRDGFPDVVGD